MVVVGHTGLPAEVVAVALDHLVTVAEVVVEVVVVVDSTTKEVQMVHRIVVEAGEEEIRRTVVVEDTRVKDSGRHQRCILRETMTGRLEEH